MGARRTGEKGAARESNSFEKGARASSIRHDSRSSVFFLEHDIFFPIGKINEKRRKSEATRNRERFECEDRGGSKSRFEIAKLLTIKARRD